MAKAMTKKRISHLRGIVNCRIPGLVPLKFLEEALGEIDRLNEKVNWPEGYYLARHGSAHANNVPPTVPPAVT